MDRIGAWSRAGKVCLWSPRLSWLVPLASRSWPRISGLTTIPGMSVPKVGNSISSVGQLAGHAARLASRMTFDFEELDYRPTPIGALSLRRRRELKLGVDVFEIKLGDEFLMSSLFTASEIALARLGLAELSEHGLDVVVGGLGLGYTAKAVLEHQKVASLSCRRGAGSCDRMACGRAGASRPRADRRPPVPLRSRRFLRTRGVRSGL